MGVIKKLYIFTSDSEESLNIPPSSDDDRDSLQNEILSYSELVTRPPRRHGRICVPMSFTGIRKQMGKKRFRRYENVYNLAVLAEGEELTEVSIRDFMPHSHFQFSKLLEHENGLELWNCLIDSREDTANKIIGLKEVKTCTNLEHNDKNSCSAKAGFQNINLALRIKLKKCNGPMGLISYLENKLIRFFMDMPKEVFLSDSMTSFERLLLHAISQYNNLISKSIDVGTEKLRLVRVSNPRDKFQPPLLSLTQYLLDKQKGKLASCSVSILQHTLTKH